MSESLTPLEKAAAIIVSLGSDNASKVYKHLHEDEVEKLSVEISKMRRIDANEMKGIMDDFYGLCVTQKVITEGGIDYAKDILEKAFGQQLASSYMDRVSKSLKTKAFNFIRRTDYKNIMSIIQNEHPQTMALILSYTSAEQAAKIIGELPKEKQVDVIDRIAKIDRVSPDVVNIIENILEKKCGNIISIDFTQLGGVHYIADIMNNVDRSTEKQIFDELSNKRPELTEEIRKLMFVFEDIIYLDDISVQKFLSQVENKELCVALKAANQEVKELIFKNMSTRVRNQIQQDIEYLRNIRMSDVESAQQSIVSVIRRLEEEGELIISKGGKDEILL